MQVSLQGICRGTGVVYALVRVTGCHAGDRLFCECFSAAGEVLPSTLRLGEPSDGPRGREALVVVPLVGGGKLTLAFFSADANGCVSSATVSFGTMRAALESKLNRLAHPTIVRRIESMAQLRPGRVDISFGPITPAAQGGMLSVHARARFGHCELFEPAIEVLDSDGRPMDAPITAHTETACPAGFGGEAKPRELTFSFPVPESTGSLVVVVRDRGAGGSAGFSALEPGVLAAGRREAREMLEDASRDPRYDAWFRAHRTTKAELARQADESRGARMKFSIVAPLFRTPVALFDEMCASVRAQSYGNWELVLVNASPDDEALSGAVAAAVRGDGRVRCIQLEGNRGIVGNTNVGVRAAAGDYVCFLDHDDTIEPDALYEYARVLASRPETALLYCDEDKVLPDGRHIDAFFKPDFSIDRLRAHNYVCHFLCVARSALDAVELSGDRHEGAQDHDLTLKVAELTNEIRHVRKVLYHWRIVPGSTAATNGSSDAPKPYATDAGHIAVSEHLERLAIPAEVLPAAWPYTHRVRYLVQGQPLVSIVIPNKDAVDMLSRCVRSVLQKTAYDNYEIVVVENNSEDARTFDYYHDVQREHDRVRVVTWPGSGFNYSKLVNFGAARAKGDYLVLLNNDTEVIAGDWLECMLGACQRADVGAVGAKLLYADGSIQHAGVVVGGGPLPAYHLYGMLPERCTGHFLQSALAGDFSAVTAACMMVSREDFDAVGGFDEGLAVLYNDVDFCLKLRERGLLVVYEPSARLYHYESATRGEDDDTPEKKRRAEAEADVLRARWPRYFEEGDPFFHPNLEAPYARLA